MGKIECLHNVHAPLSPFYGSYHGHIFHLLHGAKFISAKRFYFTQVSNTPSLSILIVDCLEGRLSLSGMTFWTNILYLGPEPLAQPQNCRQQLWLLIRRRSNMYFLMQKFFFKNWRAKYLLFLFQVEPCQCMTKVNVNSMVVFHFKGNNMKSFDTSLGTEQKFNKTEHNGDILVYLLETSLVPVTIQGLNVWLFIFQWFGTSGTRSWPLWNRQGQLRVSQG